MNCELFSSENELWTLLVTVHQHFKTSYFSLLISSLCPFKFSQKVSNYNLFLYTTSYNFYIIVFYLLTFSFSCWGCSHRNIQPGSLPLFLLLETELETGTQSWRQGPTRSWRQGPGPAERSERAGWASEAGEGRNWWEGAF